MITPDCDLCKGGCCIGDIKLFGLTRPDIDKFRRYNPLQIFNKEQFPDLRSLYQHLRSVNAGNGIYLIEFDKGDVDGIRLGACNCLVNGLCIIHYDPPGPCRRMEMGRKSCKNIFYKKHIGSEI